MFESDITKSYEDNRPMNREESRARHETSRSFRPGLKHAAAVAGGLLLAHLTYENTVGNTPNCVGEQSVFVQPGDTLTSLAQENINVTSGYVDFRGVEFEIVRPSHVQLEISGQSEGVEVGTSYMLPGDVVTMPVACEQ